MTRPIDEVSGAEAWDVEWGAVEVLNGLLAEGTQPVGESKASTVINKTIHGIGTTEQKLTEWCAWLARMPVQKKRDQHAGCV